MVHQYQRLIESVVNLEEALEKNERNIEALTAYIEEELAGRTPAQIFPDLALLLIKDADLQETYTAIRETLVAERTQQFLQPSKPLQLDFSFLRPQKSSSVPLNTNLWEKAGDIYRLTVELTAQIGERVVSLVDLSPLLQPYHQFIPAPTSMRSDPVEEEFREVQEIPLEDPNIKVYLHLGTADPKTGTGNLVVHIEPSSQNKLQPLNAIVMLQVNQRTRQRVRLTDFGLIHFDDLEPDRYLVRMEINSKTYEYTWNLLPRD